MKSSETIGGRKGIFLPFVIRFSLRFQTENGEERGRESDNAPRIQFEILSRVLLPLFPRERRNSIRNCGCANLLSKYPQTRRQRGDRTSASGRLEAGGWLRLVEKADPLDLVGTKGSARRRKRGEKEGETEKGKKGKRKEGRKELLENRRQRGWFGGCHHRFSMLDAPCLLAIVKGRKLTPQEAAGTYNRDCGKFRPP